MEKWFCAMPPFHHTLHHKVKLLLLKTDSKKTFLPGGGGAGGIIRGLGESGVEVAGCKTIFPIGHFFLIFNLKILPI